ncbi:MAG: homing endonuclease associated repeat-containing protein [bacterium]
MASWVGPAPINSNHHSPAEVAAPNLDVPWSDGRQDDDTRADHAARTRRLHNDPSYHRAALRGLAAGRRQRLWSDKAILTAIRDFHERAGRWPSQHDFRSANALPGVGTVQRRYGSHVRAVRRAQSTSSRPSSRTSNPGRES